MSEFNNELLLEKLDSIKKETADIKSEAKETRIEMRDSMNKLESKVDNNFASKERVNGVETRVEKIEENIVTKADFGPVKSVVYGLVGTLLIALIGAVVKLVLIK